MSESPYPCPCCSYLVLDEGPGSDEICEICFWQDDIVQLRFPTMGVGANKCCLVEGQRNFAEFGACELRLKEYVRPPTPDDRRDPQWRPIDPERDDIEAHMRGVKYGRTYPDDRTVLYYWRPNYWRRELGVG